MKIRSIYWRDLVNEVKYWDAFDLLRNFEEEMEKARNGLVHWIFIPPVVGSSEFLSMQSMKTLSPEILRKEDHIELSFRDLPSVAKEDIDVEITDNELFVTVNSGARGSRSVSWFHMRVPENFDIQTCDAGLDSGELKICIRKRHDRPRKRSR